MLETIFLVVLTLGVFGMFGAMIYDLYKTGKLSSIEKTLKETVVDVFGVESLALLDEAVKNVQEKLDKIRNVADYQAELDRLREEASGLRILNEEKKAEWDRKQTDIEFKVGLDRRRHEQELELSKRETVLTVREENLSKDIQRFEDRMNDQREAMKAEMDSLRTLTGQLLERLPDARMIAKIGS